VREISNQGSGVASQKKRRQTQSTAGNHELIIHPNQSSCRSFSRMVNTRIRLARNTSWCALLRAENTAQFGRNVQLSLQVAFLLTILATGFSL